MLGYESTVKSRGKIVVIKYDPSEAGLEAVWKRRMNCESTEQMYLGSGYDNQVNDLTSAHLFANRRILMIVDRGEELVSVFPLQPGEHTRPPARLFSSYSRHFPLVRSRSPRKNPAFETSARVPHLRTATTWHRQ